MSELLEIAVKTHGGLDRWNKVNSIKVDASITGAIWYVKGRADVLAGRDRYGKHKSSLRYGGNCV